MAGITYSVSVEGLDKASKAVEKFKKEMASNDDALRLGRLQIEMDKERIAGNDALAKKLSSQIELEKELIAIRSRGGLLGQTGAAEAQAKERAAQREMEIDRELAASAQQKAQLDADILAKSTAANANTLKLTGLQTQADRARVQGKELEAKKLEHQITLERELIRIQGLGGTQQQRDQMAAHARTQTVLADKQAEINQAQKLANIQRGNMPGQPMSEGAKRFRMMNVSAQLQDVAVQAQMGTALSTIVGQQAPQLISALGGTGAMAGAAAGAAISIAIVAGITQAADATHKAFQNMVTDSRTAGAEMSKALVSAQNQGDIDAALSKGAEALKTIQVEENKLYKGGAANGWARAMIRVNAALAGGASMEQVQSTILAERNAQAFYYNELNSKSIELSEARVRRSNLIAEGDERSVSALDRQLKLDKEIYEIAVSKLNSEARQAAIQAARTASRNEEIKQEKDRQKMVNDSAENMRAQLTIGQQRLNGNNAEADAMERELKFTREIQAINERKDMMPHEKATAINLIQEKSAQDREKEGRDALRKIAIEMLEDIEKDEKKIEDRRKKHRQQIEKDKIDEAKKADDDMRKLHEKADADISKAIDSIEERRKAKLKPEQRLAEAKAEMENAREIFGKFAPGSLKQKQAGAMLAEKTMEFEKLREEKREKDIQRAMGGSIAEGAARKSERAEERARARAERKVLNREVNAKRAEMERDRKPRAEIEAALDAIRGRKKDEVKDQQMAIKAAVESSATSLQILVGKLTVA